MTGRVLTPQQLPELVSTLVADRHVVALTPATADGGWAAQVAWGVARAAADGGRRVLLVDLSSEGAGLDEGATLAGTQGIAEAFQADTPLEAVAIEQSPPGLHYIGRGMAAREAPAVWSNERWRRLARGFDREGALLLLYAPPPALAALPVDELAVIVLSPEGYDSSKGAFPRIGERLAAGAPLLGVIARDAAARSPQGRLSGSTRRPRRSSATVTRAGFAAAVIVLSVGVLFAWSRGSSTERSREPRGAREVAAQAATPEIPGDSLYYSVQVAAYNTLPQALEEATRIEAVKRLAVVTPVRLGTQGVWYRVLVGALPTARAADSLLQDLWRDQALERPQGTILRTPDTYRLAGGRDEVAALRARGIPAYIVLAPNRTPQVYVGAFDLAEQAHTTDSMLAAAHLAGTLVRRTGSPP